MDRNDLNILLETKNEYSQELINALVPHIQNHFRNVYKNVQAKNKTPRYILREFQNELKNISNWTDETKSEIHTQITEKFEWLDNLINSVFVIKTQVLTAIQKGKSSLSVPIEKPQTFIYSCFLNTARELWKKPHLLYHNVNSVDAQKQTSDFYSLIRHCVKETIRKSLPIKEILRNCVKESALGVTEISSDDKHTYVKYEEPELQEGSLNDEDSDKNSDSDDDSDDDSDSNSDSDSIDSGNESHSEKHTTNSENINDTDSEDYNGSKGEFVDIEDADDVVNGDVEDVEDTPYTEIEDNVDNNTDDANINDDNNIYIEKDIDGVNSDNDLDDTDTNIDITEVNACNEKKLVEIDINPSEPSLVDTQQFSTCNEQDSTPDLKSIEIKGVKNVLGNGFLSDNENENISSEEIQNFDQDSDGNDNEFF